jgi:hypothetical protein
LVHLLLLPFTSRDLVIGDDETKRKEKKGESRVNLLDTKNSNVSTSSRSQRGVIAIQNTHYTTTKVEERKPHHQRKIAQNSEWPIDGLLLVGF